MAYNFNYPNNSSFSLITYVVGIVISVVVFILLYKGTTSQYEWTTQEMVQVEETDLGCEVDDDIQTPSTTAATQQESTTSQYQEESTTTSAQETTISESQSTTTPQQSTANNQPASSTASDSRTYSLSDIDENPEFPGGMQNMRTWLSNNLVYPAPALQNGIEGTVKVRFTVLKDGTISNVSVAQGVETHLDAEAVRLVKSMPKWTPGAINGNPVNVTYVLPIKFVM